MKNKVLTRWKTIQGPYKTAFIILVLAVVWMASGVFSTPARNLEKPSESVDQKPLTRVRVTTITGEQHTQTITVMGRVQADDAVVIKAQVLGRVSDVIARKGDQVEIGDVILRIDPEDRANRLAEAKARFRQQEIAFQAARKLRKGGYSSQLNVAKTKADLEAARAQVTRMQRDLDNTIVTAPLAGVINTLPVKAGDYFDKAGGIVGRIVNLSSMLAKGQVAERNIANIALGKVATVRLPDGRTLKGKVTYIASASNALTRTFAVEVTLNVADGSVREGVTAEIELPMETLFAHKISPALLTLDKDGQVGVKTVNGNNQVEFYPVKIISDTYDGVWLSGLPSPIRVISVGQEFVSVGQTVEAIKGRLETMVPQSGSGG